MLYVLLYKDAKEIEMGGFSRVQQSGPTSISYEEDVIDLREYLAIISKWRRVIALITLLAVAVAGFLSFFVLPPVYEAKAVVMVTQPVSSPTKPLSANQESLESVVSTISSIPQLTMNTCVAQVKNSVVLANTLAALGEKANGLNVNSLMSMIDAQTLKDTNLLEIKVSHTDPVLAAEIANTLQKQYIDFISASNREKMKKSSELLQNQLTLASENLERVEKELQQLEAEPRTLTFLQKELEGKYEELNKYYALINTAAYEYQRLAAGQAQLEEQLAALPPTITVNSSGSITGSLGIGAEGLQGINFDRSEGREELNPAYTSLSELLVQKKTELAEKAAQLETARQIAASLEEEIRTLQAETAEKKLAMDRLNSELERAKKNYDYLNEKVTEAQILETANLGEAYVIPSSSAPIPTAPVKPKKALNMTIAGVLGLMAAVMLSFLLEFLNNTIKDPADVQKVLGLPVVGTIPAIGGSKR